MNYAVDIAAGDETVAVTLVRYVPLPVPDGEPRRLRDQTIDQVHVGPPNWWERWRGITWEGKVQRIRERMQHRADFLTEREKAALAVIARLYATDSPGQIPIPKGGSGVVPPWPWPPPPAPLAPRIVSEGDPDGGRSYPGVGVNPDPTTPPPDERGE